MEKSRVEDITGQNLKDFSNISQMVSAKEPLGLKPNNVKIAGWYLLANFSVILSLLATIIIFRLLTGDSQEEISRAIVSFIKAYKFILFMVMSCSIYSIYRLIKSKEIIKRFYNIRIINKVTAGNDFEKQLYDIVSEISSKANLPKTPEIGIYESDDMNAFATGLNRKESLVAFSSALVANMDSSQISAVVAHEVAHIANGDMVAMSIIQSSVMAFSIIIQLPLTIINYFISSSSGEDNITDLIITGLMTLFQFVTFKVTMFLGNLFALYYSRKREFLADAMSAKITSSESMRGALSALQGFTHSSADKNEPEMAMFKISTNEAIIKLLSSHPPISERIQRLQNINDLV